jgi:hypothetical protein
MMGAPKKGKASNTTEYHRLDARSELPRFCDAAKIGRNGEWALKIPVPCKTCGPLMRQLGQISSVASPSRVYLSLVATLEFIVRAEIVPSRTSDSGDGLAGFDCSFHRARRCGAEALVQCCNHCL